MNSRTSPIGDLPVLQRLALAYASARSRPATLALLALDARLAQVLRGRREPIAAQLRLAWWRDMLGRPAAEWPRGEPVLDCAARLARSRGAGGAAVGWEALLAETLSPQAIAEFVDGRGQAFAALARELGVERGGGCRRGRAASGRWPISRRTCPIGAERRLVVELRPQPGRAAAPVGRRCGRSRCSRGSARRRCARGGGALLAGPAAMLLALRIGLTGR